MDQQLEGTKAGGRAVSMVGWVYVVLGALAIIFPFAAGTFVTVALGIALLAGGLLGAMTAWRLRKVDGMAPFFLALLMALAGLMFLMRPWFGMRVLTMILIIYFGATGMLRLITAFQLRPREGWGWMALDGAVSFVLGLMLWMAFPQPALWLLGLLFGIKLLFFGLVMIMTGKAVKDVAGAMQEAMVAEAEVLEVKTQESSGEDDPT
ncbi:MAG: DUF308 domain-containing protein [Planctomycetota bacterium]|nr:DUF308 domain-containing protein [Planctomycetota bacterium]